MQRLTRSIVETAISLSTVLFLSIPVTAHATSELEIRYFEGELSGIKEKAVLVLGEADAVLIDGLWMPVEATRLAEQIAASGRNLTHVLLTHGHPDHYMGLSAIRERFPKVKILARPAIREEIQYQYPAKYIHWVQLMGEQLPLTPELPEAFQGEVTMLEGHEIRWVDMPPAETMDATVFHIPDAGALIAGDVVFSKMHAYFADLNHSRGWVSALEQLRNLKPLNTVYPGHGPVGGPEVLDEALEYMRYYDSINKPGATLPELAASLTGRFPDYEGEIILWWTRGPGFGVFGPRTLGASEAVLKQLPPHLVYPEKQSCRPDYSALIDKLFHQGFEGGHMDILDEVFSANIHFSDPNFPPGLEGIKALVAKNNASFDEWRFTLHDKICDGDKVTVRWMGQGIHVGSFMGEQVTNREIKLTGISIYQIRDNKIIADWVIPDNLGFLSQIGVIKPQDMTVDAP